MIMNTTCRFSIARVNSKVGENEYCDRSMKTLPETTKLESEIVEMRVLKRWRVMYMKEKMRSVEYLSRRNGKGVQDKQRGCVE